jgi:hypothetical protein
VLLRRLPADACFPRSLAPEPEWSTTDLLLAQVVNELRQFGFLYAKRHYRDVSKPSLIKLPTGRSTGDAPRMTLAEMRARLNDPRWRPVDEVERR